MTRTAQRSRVGLVALGVLLAVSAVCAPAAVTATAQVAEARDGQSDFDFEIGSWRTEVKLLKKPLSSSTEWVEYQGTSVVHEFLDGRANFVELSIAGPAGRIEGVSLRLYHPETGQWSIHYASARDGELTAPLYGRFENGRGEFYGDDRLGDRPIRVRFVITQEGADTARFEQAYSADGGATWEVNWIATDTRL